MAFRIPMNMEDPQDKRRFNRDLYNALTREEMDKVIQMCQRVPEGPLHIINLRNDTVLHMATYSQQIDLVLRLLQQLPQSHRDKMIHQNDSGNTLLHEAAISDSLIPAAREMLCITPELLLMRNKLGETAFFQAARYGQVDMFYFLVRELDKLGTVIEEEARNASFKRDDRTTILHMSILTENFNLAILIANKYEFLIDERDGDGDGMTALQLLACNPLAMETRTGGKYLLMRLLYFIESSCRVPLWEAIGKKKQRDESAVELAKFLIARDTSWELVTGGPSTSSSQRSTIAKTTPLFLATQFGIIEIVEEILKMYPQAVEHIDDQGRNILHVAIMYRQRQIVNFLTRKKEILTRRHLRHTDNNGNSILHMVGATAKNRVHQNTENPASLLQEDLLLFEQVKRISTIDTINWLNDKGQTATKLMADNTAELHKEAKEWVKRSAEYCAVVAVLIATVTFTAAYTVPGGPNQHTGYPILISQPQFINFIIADALSLTCASASLFLFLMILTSSFQLETFKKSLPLKLALAVNFAAASTVFMMLAFTQTIILIVHNKGKRTKLFLTFMAYLPYILSFLCAVVGIVPILKGSFIKFPKTRTINSLFRHH